MFSESEGSRKTIGDVDVVYHKGLYHLFHLVLPNHDFIAHAVSTNGVNWRRVKNALFIGDPGSWDDLMLWTMHVSADPHNEGHWRMFYTGLSRREQGRIQRIGLAVSENLYHWTKANVHWRDLRGPEDPDRIQQARLLSLSAEASSHNAAYAATSGFPIEPDERYYEHALEEGRGWISFRDPYYYREDDEGWLLVAGREKEGPVIRRGCVCQLKETQPNQFDAQPPLHAPQIYDDIEVPNLIKMDGEYYLIGSIREDAKIRYWHTDKLNNSWRTYHDNVLMAKGNYAGRVAKDEHGWLIWNFFVMEGEDRTKSNVMPVPKRLARTTDGLLRIKTFETLERWIDNVVDTSSVDRLQRSSKQQESVIDGDCLQLRCDAGFQTFVFPEIVESFRFRATLRMHGRGKAGIVFRIDPATHDGYYLSLDMLKQVAQIRSWKTGLVADGENMMQFRSLQNAYWYSETRHVAELQLIAFGSYLELSVNGYVLLSLVDQTFDAGLVGIYLDTARADVTDISLHRMFAPAQSDDHLVTG